MKIIDCGEGGSKAKKSSLTGDEKSSIWPFRRKREPQEIFISSLAEALDNRFFLLGNLSLPGQGKLFPLLLLGPTGIWAILPTGITGIFRANESTWEQMDEKKQAFVPSRPNFSLQINNWAKALDEALVSLQIPAPPVEPVLFFSDSSAHVESTRSAARIVLADGLPRFLTGLFQAYPVLEKEDLRQLVIALAGEEALEPTYAGQEIKDDFSLREKKAPEKPTQKPPEAPSRLAALSREEPELVRRVSRHVPFTSRQWIYLALLLLLTMIILIALVFVVLINA
jgi:hypothetical protein